MKKLIIFVFVIFSQISVAQDNSYSIDIANPNKGIWFLVPVGSRCTPDSKGSFLQANKEFPYKGTFQAFTQFRIQVTPLPFDIKHYEVLGWIGEDLVLNIEFDGDVDVEREFNDVFGNLSTEKDYVKLSQIKDCLAGPVLSISNLRVIKNPFAKLN